MWQKALPRQPIRQPAQAAEVAAAMAAAPAARAQTTRPGIDATDTET